MTTDTAVNSITPAGFIPADPIGFYPIVDRAAWLTRLLPEGVKTIQLRVKDLTGSALRQEIATAIDIAKQFPDVALYINDHWQLAIELGAYGVHLGQEDVDIADLAAIANNGLRLGLSTHNREDVQSAVAMQVSYIAMGQIFDTTSKIMKQAPLGLDYVRYWRERLPDQVLVAIGGLKLEHAPVLREIGVGMSVITAITESENPESMARQLSRMMNL